MQRRNNNHKAKTLIYEISEDGKITSEAFGFEGKSCEILNDALEGLQDEQLEHRDKPEKQRRVYIHQQRQVKTR